MLGLWNVMVSLKEQDLVKIDQRIMDLAFWNNFKIGVGVMHDDYAIAKATAYVIENEIEGDIVELGCNVGESAKIIQHVIQELGSDKKLYVYDSFEGLPAPNKEKGDTWHEGDLKVSQTQLIANFEKNNLNLPVIVKGWFRNITTLPEKIAFAFYDGDLYDSIKDSFEISWNQVSSGGLIAVHDYFARSLQGVKKATDEFTDNKGCYVWYAHKDQNNGNDILILCKR